MGKYATAANLADESRFNKAAFDEVIGDPWSTDEDRQEGSYPRFKRKGIKVQQINDLGHASVNPARPMFSDFFVDVENIVAEVITDPTQRDQFWETYLYEVPILSPQERNLLEQRLGKKFRLRGLIPVKNYFIVIK